MPDRRRKDRPPRQPGKALDFRHVLVLETECVKLEGRATLVVMRLDHRSAAARIAAYRADRDRVIARDESRFDQRAQQRDGARRIATGIADLAGHRNLL